MKGKGLKLMRSWVGVTVVKFDSISKGKKTAINEGGDILYEGNVVLEERKEKAKSKGVASRLIEEREIEVLNIEKSMCYESPREERVFCTFEHLISNIKLYNGVKI